MIKARHHTVIYPMFKWLSRVLIKRKFNSVQIDRPFTDNGKAVLVISNHISWWDGFWIMQLNDEVLHRKFHFMMLEEQLKEHWYFQYTGGFSVKKRSRESIESINYSIELLREPGNLVLIFPQGEIQSMHRNDMKFEKGINRIIKGIPDEIQILLVANLVDYFSNSAPSLYVYTKSFLAGDVQKLNIEQEYNSFYQDALSIQKTKTS